MKQVGTPRAAVALGMEGCEAMYGTMVRCKRLDESLSSCWPRSVARPGRTSISRRARAAAFGSYQAFKVPAPSKANGILRLHLQLAGKGGKEAVQARAQALGKKRWKKNLNQNCSTRRRRRQRYVTTTTHRQGLVQTTTAGERRDPGVCRIHQSPYRVRIFAGSNISP